jgi:hypothetical protein
MIPFSLEPLSQQRNPKPKVRRAPALVMLALIFGSVAMQDAKRDWVVPAQAQTSSGMQLIDRIGGGAYAIAARERPDGRREIFHGSGARVGYALHPTPPETRPLAHLGPPMAGLIRGLALAGERLWVTTGDGGLQVLDVSQPQDMRILATLSLRAVADAIVLRGDRAYLSLGIQGLAVVDIRDAENPKVLTRLAAPGGELVRDLALASSGDLLLVASGVAGLRILTLAEPDAPVEVGALERVDGFPLDVEAVHAREEGGVAGQEAQAWISDGPRLHRIDLSAPAAPVVAKSVEFPMAQVRAISSTADEIIVSATADLDASIRIYQLDPAQPKSPLGDFGLRAGHWTPGIFALPIPAPALASTGQHVYLAAGGEGVLGLDTAIDELRYFLRSDHPSWPESSIGIRPLPPRAGDTPVEGLAVVASGDGRMEAREIPALSPSEESPDVRVGAATDLLLLDDRIIGACSALGLCGAHARLQPGRPMLALEALAPSPLLEGAHRLASTMDGMHLYVADQIDGLRILSLEDPDDPQDLGGIDLGLDYPEDVFVAGEVLFVAYGNGVSAFDIRSPARPRLLSSVETPGFARGLAAWTNEDADSGSAGRTLVFVADDQEGLTLIDAWVPDNMRVVANVDTPGSAQSVTVDVTGRHVYVADGEGGLQAFLVPGSKAEDTRWTRAFTLAEEAVHVYWNEGLIQVSSRGYGFFVLEDPDAPRPAPPAPPEPSPLLLPFLQSGD